MIALNDTATTQLSKLNGIGATAEAILSVLSDQVVPDLGALVIATEPLPLQLENLVNASTAILDNTNLLLTNSDTLNSLTTTANDKFQFYVGNAAGDASTVSLQDQVAQVYAYYGSDPSADNYLFTTSTNTANLNNWDSAGKCKVVIAETVTVDGTVAVEPGGAPLEVVVVA